MYATYQQQIEQQLQTDISSYQFKQYLVDLGNPKDVVKKEMKGIESSLSPTAGTLKRSMGFMPFILTIGWTLNNDLYQQMARPITTFLLAPCRYHTVASHRYDYQLL
ncbi:hypothetical protein [Paenibacillus sp. SYP-B4298]|uniref:hypothetical protein n=1 Tax=Paenibacillus sp. SYP-B4298 TaxID=2996034 RepID=UPI0022DDE3E6|nr:hypothetical protein [Paenibacillus sp. SYP-B4298]